MSPTAIATSLLEDWRRRFDLLDAKCCDDALATIILPPLVTFLILLATVLDIFSLFFVIIFFLDGNHRDKPFA